MRGGRHGDGDLLLQPVEPRRDIGKVGRGRGGSGRRRGLLLQRVEPRRKIGELGGDVGIGALAERLETRGGFALEPVEPVRRRLRERRPLVAGRGPVRRLTGVGVGVALWSPAAAT